MQAAEEACRSGQYSKAISLFKEALEIWPAGENPEKRGHALKEMARCARHARDFGAARLAWEEILATCRASGSAEGEIEAHNQLAEFSQLVGDHTAAVSSLRKAAELRQQTGSALQAARQWFSLAGYLTSRIRLRDAFGALREFQAPKFELTGPMPYIALQSMFDAIYPPGDQWYWRGDFVAQIPDEAIEQHLKFAEQLPTLKSTMHLYPVDGAASRIGRHETAFSYRDAKWSMVIVGVDPDPANAEKITTWTKDYWTALHPFSLGGAYVNFMMDEGVDRIKATYRENYDRLGQIKRKYDPDNFLRINQNIKPA